MENKKSILRKIKQHERSLIPKSMRKSLSKKICELITKTNLYSKSNSIGCYYPIGSEVDVRFIFNDIFNKNKKLFLPKIKNKTIEFYMVENLKNLEQNQFGILEPKCDQYEMSNSLDVVIVPSIALTRHGTRLGYGKGYYDKFLCLYNHKTVSPIYSSQLINFIPTSKYDVSIDYIVTEISFFKSSY